MKGVKKEYYTPSELPIYKGTYKLLEACIAVMVKMNRDLKHTIGQKIVNLCLDSIAVLNSVFYTQEDKLQIIQHFIADIDCIEQLIKICTETSKTTVLALEQKDYVNIMPHIANVKRQAIGWHNSMTPND